MHKFCESDKSFTKLLFIKPFSGRKQFLEPGQTSTIDLFFLPKYFKLLTIFAKNALSQMFDWVENRFLAKGLKY